MKKFKLFEKSRVGDKIIFCDDVKGIVIHGYDIKNHTHHEMAVLLTNHEDQRMWNVIASGYFDQNITHNNFKLFRDGKEITIEPELSEDEKFLERFVPEDDREEARDEFKRITILKRTKQVNIDSKDKMKIVKEAIKAIKSDLENNIKADPFCPICGKEEFKHETAKLVFL